MSCPEGCMLSPPPVHYLHPSETTVVGLIMGGGESVYREEIQELSEWYIKINLTLNTTKTKQLAIGNRKRRKNHSPLAIKEAHLVQVDSFKFLGTLIQIDLKWTATSQHWLKRLRGSTFCEYCRGTTWRRNWWCPSTGRPLSQRLCGLLPAWLQTEGSAEDNQNCRKDRWMPCAIPGRRCQVLLLGQSSEELSRHFPAWTESVWTVAMRKVLQVIEVQNKQTKEQILPLGCQNPELLTMITAVILSVTRSLFTCWSLCNNYNIQNLTYWLLPLCGPFIICCIYFMLL